MRPISIVLPAYNALGTLPRVLPALQEAFRRGDVAEILVVDDCSTDASAQYCREQGLTVLRTSHRSGPAGARNLGVEHATGDLILFIDADVVMRADVPSRVQAAFSSEDSLAAVFGSYDDHPPERNFASQYMNLRHHHIHQRGAREASTFWAGCGAVSRAAYLDVHGFDTHRFAHPSIEDVELGYRLRRAGGRILLDRDMQCTHLKRWTLSGMIHTDIFRRARPWARLMLQPDYQAAELNVTWAERRRALLAGLIWLSLAGALVYPAALLLTATLLIAAYFANREFFKIVRRSAGLTNMLVSVLLHQLYYTYSSIVYVCCFVEALFKRPRI